MRLDSYFFFFFQAEDGIRDYKVTGVQTCALPISLQVTRPLADRGELALAELDARGGDILLQVRHRRGAGDGQHHRGRQRSEEHTSELQSPCNLVCRLLLEKKKKQ